MKKKSKFSKHLEAKLWTLRIFDILILVVPLIIYVVMGFMDEGTLLIEKTALVGTTVGALILTLVNIFFKKRYRSVIWILVLGIYIAVTDIMPLICCIAVATILDEFVIQPMINRIHTKYLASITMDEREQAQ